MDQLLTPRQFAQRINHSVYSVWRWIRQGWLPVRFVRRGSERRYFCDEHTYQTFLKKKTIPLNQ